MVNSVEFGGYANDDNRRAEWWMMGSLGTPGDQPRNKSFQTETFDVENSEDVWWKQWPQLPDSFG